MDSHLQFIDKENMGPQIGAVNNRQHKKESNGVSVDMLDCDGEKRVAMIVHNPTAKVSLRNLFTPLRPSKKHKSNNSDISLTSKKRSRESVPSSRTEKKPTVLEEKRRKRSKKIQMTEYITKVLKVNVSNMNGQIYDSCPEVASKIEEFLERPGVTPPMFIAAIDIHGNSLRNFLKGVNQEQCTNICYRHAYFFFEKLRLLEDAPKTLRRLQNEAYLSTGFDVKESGKLNPTQGDFNLIEFVFC